MMTKSRREMRTIITMMDEVAFFSFMDNWGMLPVAV